MSKWVSKHIEGISTCYEKLDSITSMHYDVIIAAANWDERSVAVSKIQNISSDIGLQFSFQKKDDYGRQEKHESIIQDWLKSCCKRTESIVLKDRDNVEIFWGKIKAAFEKIFKELNNTISIFIDLTVFPRIYSIGIMSNLISAGLLEKITFFYSEADYATKNSGTIETFRKGSWAAIPIFGLAASYDPGKEKFYMISVGFEGGATMRVIEKGDPERISILFPKPGFKEQYEQKAWDVNKEIIEKYAVSKEQIIEATAGDAIVAWQKLEERNLERPDKENNFSLCCGTRPHSLALALRAITAGFPITVLYYIPDEYAVTNIKESGKYWLYEIRDLSVVPRALRC